MQTASKKFRTNSATANRFIKKGLGSNIYKNVLGINSPKGIWDKLLIICQQVGHGVVYAILQKILAYPKIIKPLGYKKKATTIFAKLKALIQRLEAAVTPPQTIWDIMVIIIALDSLLQVSIHPEVR